MAGTGVACLLPGHKTPPPEVHAIFSRTLASMTSSIGNNFREHVTDETGLLRALNIKERDSMFDFKQSRIECSCSPAEPLFGIGLPQVRQQVTACIPFVPNAHYKPILER